MFKKKTSDDLFSTKNIKLPKSMVEVDKLSGKNFEIFICDYFNEVYEDIDKIELTDDTGDKGLDILIDFKNGKRIGIQAKRWKSSVGSVEVSKMLRGKSHYKVDNLYFITNSTLTAQAKTAAFNENVEVWDREEVLHMLNDLNNALGKEIKPENKNTYIIDEYLEELKEIRKEIGKKYNLYPLYTVFTDKTLNEIIKTNPRKVSELKNISGLGDKKIALFGDFLISKINQLHKKLKSVSVRSVEVKYTHSNNETNIDSIKELRKKIAKKYNIYPLYTVFKDETAIELAKYKPKTLNNLYAIKGMGEKRVSKFGNDIIDFFNNNS